MTNHRRSINAVAAVLALTTLVACVQRRIVITSDPPAAAVMLNDTDVGLTPLEVDFTYFGVYDVQIRRPGYEPLLTTAHARAPWYETPGVDIISQAIPPTDRTVIRWHFVLEPIDADADQLLDRALELKSAVDRSADAPSP